MNVWAPIAVLLFVVGLGLAVASGFGPAGISGKEPDTLETFGRANASCRQWTDGCSTCKRQDDGSFSCSLPGIACQPSSLTCRQVKQGSRPAGVEGQPTK